MTSEDFNSIQRTPTSPATLLTDDALSSTDSDASASDTHTAVPADKRCKYPSKYCSRARVRKSNGTCHRFCQYHRIKANTNQKRWTSVRRQQAVQDEQHRRRAEAVAAVRQVLPPLPPYGREMVNRPWMPELLPDPVSLSYGAEPMGLPLEDVAILHALFVGETPELPDLAMYATANCHPAVYKPHAFGHFDIAL